MARRDKILEAITGGVTPFVSRTATSREVFAALCKGNLHVEELSEHQISNIVYGIALGLSYQDISESDGMPNKASIIRAILTNRDLRAQLATAYEFAAQEDIHSLKNIETMVMDGNLEPEQGRYVLASRKFRVDCATKRYTISELNVIPNDDFAELTSERREAILREAVNG